jgi:hypothetical protein
LSGGLVFPAEIPLIDRRCRFAVAPWSSLPLPVPFPRKPNPTTVSPWLRRRDEETPAATSPRQKNRRLRRSELASKCSQQVMLATRKLPQQLPLSFSGIPEALTSNPEPKP